MCIVDYPSEKHGHNPTFRAFTASQEGYRTPLSHSRGFQPSK
jgi:hypothetical protein